MKPETYDRKMDDKATERSAMATYPRCRECGNELTCHEEQEQELCFDCQEFDTCPECGATLVHFSGLESIREYLYCPY